MKREGGGAHSKFYYVDPQLHIMGLYADLNAAGGSVELVEELIYITAKATSFPGWFMENPI